MGTIWTVHCRAHVCTRTNGMMYMYSRQQTWNNYPEYAATMHMMENSINCSNC